MSTVFILRVIIVPFVLSAVFLVLAGTGTLADSANEQMEFAAAAIVSAAIGCLGIWLVRRANVVKEEPEGPRSLEA